MSPSRPYYTTIMYLAGICLFLPSIGFLFVFLSMNPRVVYESKVKLKHWLCRAPLPADISGNHSATDSSGVASIAKLENVRQSIINSQKLVQQHLHHQQQQHQAILVSTDSTTITLQSVVDIDSRLDSLSEVDLDYAADDFLMEIASGTSFSSSNYTPGPGSLVSSGTSMSQSPSMMGPSFVANPVTENL